MSKLVKDSVPSNIPLIFVTFAVLNVERLSVFSDVVAENIPDISVTFDVLTYCNPSIDVKFEHPLNRFDESGFKYKIPLN